MAKKFLVPIDLAKNELQNARIQNLASAPSSPVTGQEYFDTALGKFGVYNGATWDYMGTSTATGDFSSNTSSSVDGEAVVFSGTAGKTGKRFTGSGIVKAASGVLSIATSGTDYAPATSGSAILKGNGSGGFSSATQGTDYYAPSGTDVAVADGGTGASTLAGVLKGNGTSAVTGGAVLGDLGTTAADFSMNSHKLTSVTDPTSAQDAATKAYVDSLVQGLSWKTAVIAATTANGTLSSAYANGSTIDGITLATGNRILIKNQTTGSENGIYTVNASGAPTRATDADSGTELNGATVYVTSGTSNADTAWTQTAESITIGTTATVWAQINGGTVPSASTSVAGKVQLATQAEAQAKTDTAKALTAASVSDFARKYTGTIGDGSSTSLAVTHGLGSQYVTAQVFDASSGVQVECDVTLTSGTLTTFDFTVAPTSAQYRVVITG